MKLDSEKLRRVVEKHRPDGKIFLWGTAFMMLEQERMVKSLYGIEMTEEQLEQRITKIMELLEKQKDEA